MESSHEALDLSKYGSDANHQERELVKTELRKIFTYAKNHMHENKSEFVKVGGFRQEVIDEALNKFNSIDPYAIFPGAQPVSF